MIIFLRTPPAPRDRRSHRNCGSLTQPAGPQVKQPEQVPEPAAIHLRHRRSTASVTATTVRPHSHRSLRSRGGRMHPGARAWVLFPVLLRTETSMLTPDENHTGAQIAEQRKLARLTQREKSCQGQRTSYADRGRRHAGEAAREGRQGAVHVLCRGSPASRVGKQDRARIVKVGMQQGLALAGSHETRLQADEIRNPVPEPWRQEPWCRVIGRHAFPVAPQFEITSPWPHALHRSGRRDGGHPSQLVQHRVEPGSVPGKLHSWRPASSKTRASHPSARITPRHCGVGSVPGSARATCASLS